MSVTNGTFVSDHSGEKVSRVLTPSKTVHPEDVIKDVCRCRLELCGGVVEVVYCGAVTRVDFAPDTLSEEIRQWLRPRLDDARKTYFASQKILTTSFA